MPEKIKIWFLKKRINSLYRIYVKNLAKNQKASIKFKKNFEIQKEIILNFYKYISLLSQKSLELPFSAKWLVENKDFLLIEVHNLSDSISKKLLDSLPKVNEESFADPIIYKLVKDFLIKNKGWFSSKKFIEFLQDFQNSNNLILDEIFSLQLIFHLIFVEEIAKCTFNIFEFINANIDSKKENFRLDIHGNNNSNEYLYFLLEFQNQKNFSDYGVKKETISFAKKAIKGEKLGQSIQNIKKLNETNWDLIFRQISKVVKILASDPAGIYTQMGPKSQNYYLNQVKLNSKKYQISEIDYVDKLVAHAGKGFDEITKHIGYYLIDDGVEIIENELGYKNKTDLKNNFWKRIYVFSLISGTGILSIAIFNVAQGHIINKLLLTVFSLVPIYLLSKKLLLKIASKIDKNKKLPALRLQKNLSKEESTVFCIPAFIKNKSDINKLIETLETIFLANRGGNIFFSLLLDFPDSSKQYNDGEEILQNDLSIAIKNLNAKYSFKNKFSYFLRKRVWSENQGLWMGWERKRGKVLEFLRAIRKLNTKSEYFLSLKNIPDFKYVLIVDEDSQVTKNLVYDLVGVIHHPLNRPVLDEKFNYIKRGFVIVRTQSGYLYSTKEQSVFSKILCGANGYNHYSSTSNEIYFKFFGESLFTGKGILDIDLFLKLTNETFPDDTIVSHDHIEGMLCRVGFAGEGQVFEGFPTSVKSYLLRLHRWIRGDWQILNWLFLSVKNKKGNTIRNPISFIDKIKIFDSLVNSFLIPNLFILTLIITLLDFANRDILYTVLLVEFFAFDYLSGLIELIIKFIYKRKIKFLILDFIALSKFMLKDKFFEFVYLPYLAFLQFNAIIKAIFRRFFTLKNTLEWTTFTSIEGNKNNNKAYLKIFLPAWLFLLSWLLVISIYHKTDTFILLLIFIWLISPLLVNVYDIKLKPSN